MKWSLKFSRGEGTLQRLVGCQVERRVINACIAKGQKQWKTATLFSYFARALHAATGQSVHDLLRNRVRAQHQPISYRENVVILRCRHVAYSLVSIILLCFDFSNTWPEIRSIVSVLYSVIAMVYAAFVWTYCRWPLLSLLALMLTALVGTR